MPTDAQVEVPNAVSIGVLGPIEMRGVAGPITPASAKERALIAHLAARVGHTVSTDDLIDTVWGQTPPRTAGKALQNHIVNLRRLLEPDHNGSPTYLLTDAGGYRLTVPAEWIDANQFEQLVDLGRRAFREGRLSAAAETLRAALALWRGRAYLGLESTTIGSRESRRLEELRLLALEDRIAADLDLGRARETIGEIETLVQDEPLRERIWILLVLALYRAGRQGEALNAYARARQCFIDELGIEPGPELRRLHEQVLAQDRALDGPEPQEMLPDALIPPASPFLGRAGELARLRAAWDLVLTTGSPVTVIVRGPRGSGVGRLTAEFAAELADTNIPVALMADSDPAPEATRPMLVVQDRRSDQVTQIAAREPTGPVLRLVLALGHQVGSSNITLDLEPLGADDVRAILSEYVDADMAAAVLSDVQSSTRGWPGRVHDAALRIARESAANRVSGAAARAQQVQAAMGEARLDLRVGVTRYQEVIEQSAPIEPDVCPWKGLAAYDVADASWYSGRERLVADLLTRVASNRLVAVVGASGSGKSSLLRAGLLASLDAGALPGSEGWRPLLMRPGAHPMRELVWVCLRRAQPPADRVAELLQRAVFGEGSDDRAVIVIDQFEELWTVCSDEVEREAFLAAISSLVDSDSPCTVVIAIRADHVGRIADHAEFVQVLADSTLLVGSPSAAELRRAVERPAARAGLIPDVGLVDAIVDDAQGQPGALPLLSTALTRLWSSRQGRHLTLAAYSGGGGLQAAVAHLAENAYASLDADDQAAARVLFLRLAADGQGDAVTRRRVPLSELTALPNPRVAAVVEPLADARLLTVDAGYVEVAHEALFREWPRLRAWLDEQAQAQRIRRRLAIAATDWEQGGRDAGEVWQGTRLAAGVELMLAAPDEVTALERDFLEVGQAQLDADRREAEQRAATSARQNKRLRWLLGGGAVLLVAASVAGVLALRAQSEATRAQGQAEREARVASARDLASAATAVVDEDAELGILLATEAVRTTREVDGSVLPQAEEALHGAVTAARVVDVFPGVGGALAWSPDGTFFVPEGPEQSGRIEIRDAATGELVRSWVGHEIDLNDVFISANATVATSGDDGAAVAWDPKTGKEIGRIQSPSSPSDTWSPQLSADGSVLAAGDGGAGSVRVLNLKTGRQREFTGLDRAWTLALSPDGRKVALASRPGRLGIYDVKSGRRLMWLAGTNLGPADMAWSPNGKWLLASLERDSRVWKVKNGDLLATLLPGQRAYAPVVAWSPDSRLAGATGHDGTARVWSVGSGGAQLSGVYAASASRDGLLGIGFGAKSDRLMVGSFDVEGQVTVFDISPAGSAEVGTARSVPDWVGMAVHPDGQRIYITSPGHTAKIIDARSGRALGPFGDPLSDSDAMMARQLVLSPDGSRLFAAGWAGYGVWDTATGERLFASQPKDWWPAGASWSPDGRLVAVAGYRDGRTVILDETGTQVGVVVEDPDHESLSVAFSPDGDSLATGRARVDVQLGKWGVTLWDWRTGEKRWTVDAEASGLAFTEDGDLVIASRLGPLLVVDGDTAETIATLPGHVGGTMRVATSPDGTTVATGGRDGLVRLWDTSNWTQRLALPGHDAGQVWGVGFSPDSRTLVSAGEDGTTRIWALDLDDLLGIAASKEGRSLTDQECRQYLHLSACPARPQPSL